MFPPSLLLSLLISLSRFDWLSESGQYLSRSSRTPPLLGRAISCPFECQLLLSLPFLLSLFTFSLSFSISMFSYSLVLLFIQSVESFNIWLVQEDTSWDGMGKGREEGRRGELERLGQEEANRARMQGQIKQTKDDYTRRTSQKLWNFHISRYTISWKICLCNIASVCHKLRKLEVDLVWLLSYQRIYWYSD